MGVVNPIPHCHTNKVLNHYTNDHLNLIRYTEDKPWHMESNLYQVILF